MKSESLKKVLSMGLGLAAIGSLVFMTAGHAAKGVIKNPNQGGQANFKVEIDGLPMSGVLSIDGIKVETEVIEYRDGEDMTIRKRPGGMKYGDITLKRGFTDNNDLWRWYQEVIKGQTIRKSISIIMNDYNGAVIGRYNFFEAWPCRWEGPELDSGRINGDPDFDMFTEKITFCVERMERK